MAEKLIRYQAGLDACLANAQAAGSTEMRDRWMTVAASYQLLIALETGTLDGRCTPPGRRDSAVSPRA